VIPGVAYFEIGLVFLPELELIVDFGQTLDDAFTGEDLYFLDAPPPYQIDEGTEYALIDGEGTEVKLVYLGMVLQQVGNEGKGIEAFDRAEKDELAGLGRPLDELTDVIDFFVMAFKVA